MNEPVPFRVRTRIKICGITRTVDARAAVDAGADALGLVFWPGTPRVVGIDQARAIVATVPPYVTIVGLFVDPEPQAVRAVLDTVSIDVLQFHGSEPADTVPRVRTPLREGDFGEGRRRFARIGVAIRRRCRIAVRCVQRRRPAGRHGPHVRLGPSDGRRSQPFAVPADPFGRTYCRQRRRARSAT